MKKLAVGLDIGGTDIKAGLVGMDGHITALDSIPTEAEHSRQRVLQNIKTVISRLLEKNHVCSCDLLGIGAGTPGLPDAKGTIVTGASNIRGWNGTPLGSFLSKAFQTKAIVENDVTALAAGESCFGNGKKFHNIIVLAFGTGLGGGIIIDKKIYRGHSGYAAEIGHVFVNGEKDAPFCTCGARGCLETYASTVGIKRMLKENVEHRRTILTESSMPRDVYEAAGKNDPFAKEIVQTVGYRLGIGLATLVHIFDPEAVIFGGGIANAGKIFFDSFQKSYTDRILPHYKKNKVRFLSTKLGREGGIVGTASLILQPVSSQNLLT